MSKLLHQEKSLCSTSSSPPKDLEDLLKPKLLNGGHLPDLNILNLIFEEFLLDFDFILDHDDVVHIVKQLSKKHKIQNLKLSHLLYVYRTRIANGEMKVNNDLFELLRTNPARGNLGVSVYTVLTAPNEMNAGKSRRVGLNSKTGEEIPTNNNDHVKKVKQSCQFDCYFCPMEPGQPRSYISKEPAVARANENNFDVVLQVRDRANGYINTGNETDKAEVLVLGGTWSSYSPEYQVEFIRDLYYAYNTLYDKKMRERLSLEEEIKLNETALCHVIGLTLETRPDQINVEELRRFRRFGVTRVQIGIQHTNDEILKYNNRGCYLADTISAIYLLKRNCFKITAHLMPDLPSSNPDEDYRMMMEVLTNPDLQIDQLKIYPCEVIPWTRIEKWYNNFKNNYDTDVNSDQLLPRDNRVYQPYSEHKFKKTVSYINDQKNIKKLKELNNKLSDLEEIPLNKQTDKTNSLVKNLKEQITSLNQVEKEIDTNPLLELLVSVLPHIPEYVRVERIRRDFPTYYSHGGHGLGDYRTPLENEIYMRGGVLRDIRTRQLGDEDVDLSKAKLIVRPYPASKGKEFFISFEVFDEKKTNDVGILIGFCRLRLPTKTFDKSKNLANNDDEMAFKELEETALVRELHVYGRTTVVGKNAINGQHHGFGKRLLREAERIAVENDYSRIAVIAGVGVRNYYRKQGYLDAEGLGNFQIKNLHEESKKKREAKNRKLYLLFFVLGLLLALIVTMLMK
jgi:histone acetyltransferase (RNA polymerase elongator complex component)